MTATGDGVSEARNIEVRVLLGLQRAGVPGDVIEMLTLGDQRSVAPGTLKAALARGLSPDGTVAVKALRWSGHPTPLEAVARLRRHARNQKLPPNDNDFEDAAAVIERLLIAVNAPLVPINKRETSE